MNFGEQIVSVLNKMVVPEYDPIDYVIYKVYGDYGDKRFYEIMYVIKESNFDNMDVVMKLDLVLKTQSIVPFVGISAHEDYAIYFRNGKDDIVKKIRSNVELVNEVR